MAQQDEGPSGAQLGAMGIAAASPFAGMIGQQKVIHDPLQGAEGTSFKNMKDVSRAAQPGDVLMTSKAKGSLFKNFITPAGDSQFYHAQPVTGRQDGIGYTMSAGDLYDQGIPASKALNHDTPIHEYMKSPETSYSDAVLLRPKQKLTPEQMKTLKTDYGKRITRGYDNDKALSTFARELFVPKLEGLANMRPETVCEGNVCSTLPAMSMNKATGKRVVPGKASQDVFPTDFMRSNEYELVGSHITPETRALEGSRLRKIMPYAMRAGIGAGLAGGTYAASEEPATVGGALGAYGANKAIDAAFTNQALHDKLPERLSKVLSTENYERFPNLWEVGGDIMEKNPGMKSRLGRYFTGRVPLLAAGAGLGYGAGKLLENSISE